MSNIPQEAGKVASNVADALKGNPLCLSLVVLVIVIAAVAYFRNQTEMNNNRLVIMELMERCMEPAKR